MKWATVEALARDLERHKVPIHLWRAELRTRTVTDLFKEIKRRDCILSLKMKVRTIRSLLLDVQFEVSDGVVYCLHERSLKVNEDGTTSITRNKRGISEHLRIGESANSKAIIRALEEELGVGKFLSCVDRGKHRNRHNGVYKGIETRNTLYKFIVELHPEDFNPNGYVERRDGQINYFTWHPVPDQAKR